LDIAILHNEKLFNEVIELNDDYIRVTKDLPEEQLVGVAIEILNKKQGWRRAILVQRNL